MESFDEQIAKWHGSTITYKDLELMDVETPKYEKYEDDSDQDKWEVPDA